MSTFIIVQRQTTPPPTKPEYTDLGEAVAAFKAAQATTANPDSLVLVRIDTDATSVTTTDLVVQDVPSAAIAATLTQLAQLALGHN
jgi:hypothetical protein